MKNNHNNSSVRLDKWLWAARFFKTCMLAQKHIELGRALVNGSKVKNSKNISADDTIDVTPDSLPYKLEVAALNRQRRPAPEARLLHEEDMKTATEYETQKQLDQASRISAAYPNGCPTKRNRRQLDRMKHDSW